MKRFFFIAATILAAACTREPIIPEESVDPAEERSGRIDVTLVAGNPETRTEVFNDGSLKPYWSKDDNISVVFIDGDEFEYDPEYDDYYWYHPFTSGLNQRALSAQFTGSVSQAGQYRAFYPANEWVMNEYGDSYYQEGPYLDRFYNDDLGYSLPGVVFNIPVVQYPSATSFDPNADLLVSAPFEIEDSGNHELGGDSDEIPIRFTRANAIVKVKFNPSGELRTMLAGQKVRKVSFNTMSDIQEGGGDMILNASSTRAIVVDNDENDLNLTGRATYLLPYVDDLEFYDVNEDDRYTIERWGGSSSFVIAQYTDDTAYDIVSDDPETATYFMVFPSILQNNIDTYDGTYYEGLPIRIETDDYVITRDIRLRSGGIALQPSVVTTLGINLTLDNVMSVERKGISFKNSETTLIPGDGEKVQLFAHNIYFPGDEIEDAQDFYDFFTITAQNNQGDDCSDIIKLRYVTYEETDYDYKTYVYNEYVDDLFLSVDEDAPAGDYEVTVTFEGYSVTCIVHVITTSDPIDFADANVEAICVNTWGGHLVPGKLTKYEASKVTDLSSYFKGNTSILSFEELAYFTGLETVGNRAFENCQKLKSIVIPETVTNIEYRAFYNCMALESITLSPSLSSIGEEAFQYCTSLESISLPEGFAWFSRYAFSNCSSLKSIVLPSSFRSALPDYGFEGCSSLESVTILGEVTTVGNYTFRYCRALKEINIPDGTYTIYNGAFYGCTSLESISIPGSVRSIMTNAFYGCSNLSEVILQEGVVELRGQYIFNDCTSLHEIVFPASLTSIGHSYYSNGYVFRNVEFRSGTDGEGNEYHGVKFLGSTPPRFDNSDITISGKHWDATANDGQGGWVDGVTVYVPRGSRSAYESMAPITNNGQNTIIEYD